MCQIAINDRRIPSLDGWRAISILLVLGAHSRYASGFPENASKFVDVFFDGALGVRIFFIISGFLITTLLLEENRKNGSINIKKFYIRRIIRIWPVYFLYLLVVFILQKNTSFYQGPVNWIQNITFTTGINFPGSSLCYTTLHLWSLAVEEQFYLVWPLLFVFLSLPSNFILSCIIVFIPIIISPIFRVVVYTSFYPEKLSWLLGAGFAFPCTFDSIAVGCLIAFLSNRYSHIFLHELANRLKLYATLGGLFIIIPHIFKQFYILGFLTVPFGNTIQNVGVAFLLLQSIYCHKNNFYAFLNTKPLVYIGILSYSLYIWQQLLSTPLWTFGIEKFWPMTFPFHILTTFLVAFISYQFIEKPFLGLRKKFK